MPLENIHTHTWRCGHASGDVDDYIKAAETLGCRALGFSDHTPLPGGRWSGIRMDITQLPGYIAAVDHAKKTSSLPAVYLGLECEWDPAFKDFYENEVLPAGNFDYLAGAVHFFPWQGEWLYIEEVDGPAKLAAYADQLIRTMASRFFTFAVHPDAFLAGYRKWDDNSRSCARDILQAASEYGAVLEINGNGFRKRRQKKLKAAEVFYPHDRFWRLAAEYGIKAVCSSDAHNPEEVCESLDDCRHMASDCGVRIIEAADLIRQMP